MSLKKIDSKNEAVAIFSIKKDYIILELVPSILKDTKSFIKKQLIICQFQEILQVELSLFFHKIDESLY